MFQTAKQHELTVIKNLTGHGIGSTILEAPDHIYNYSNASNVELLKEGMVIAFELFIQPEVFEKADGGTYATEKSYIAQLEQSIILSKNGLIIVTL